MIGTYLDGYDIPDDVPDGTYCIWVLADSNNDVDESDDDNNWGRSAYFTINHTDPDLVVDDVTGTESYYETGDDIWATAHILNDGDASAGSFDLHYYLGTSSDQTYDSIEQGTIFGGADPQELVTDIIDWPYYQIDDTIPPGEYCIWVLADSNEDVDESDDDNNWGRSAFFTISEPFAPTITSAVVPDTNRVDNDQDGFCQWFQILFFVTSSRAGSYYWIIYEHDGYIFDDTLTAPSDTIDIDAGETLNTTLSMAVGDIEHLPGDDADGEIEIRIDLYDATSGNRLFSVTPHDYAGLGGVLVENPEDDDAPPVQTLFDFTTEAGQIAKRFIDFITPLPFTDVLQAISDYDFNPLQILSDETHRHLSFGVYAGFETGIVLDIPLGSLRSGYTLTYDVYEGDWKIAQGITLNVNIVGGSFLGDIASLGAGVKAKAHAEQYLYLDKDLSYVTAGFGLSGSILSGFDVEMGIDIPFGGVVSAELQAHFEEDLGTEVGFAIEREMETAEFATEVGYAPGEVGDAVLASLTPYGDGWWEYLIDGSLPFFGPLGSLAIQNIRGEPIPARLITDAGKAGDDLRVVAIEQLVEGASLSIQAGLTVGVHAVNLAGGAFACYSESKITPPLLVKRYDKVWATDDMTRGDVPGDTDDHGDYPYSASDFRDVINFVELAEFDSPNDEDWIRVTADSGQEYFYYTRALTGLSAAPSIELHSLDGELLAPSELTSSGQQRLTWTPDSTGDYLIRFAPSVDGESGEYTFELANFDPYPDDGGNESPDIGSFDASPADVSEDETFNLIASGVSDPDGDNLDVQFYWDADGNEYWNPDGDQVLDGLQRMDAETWVLADLPAEEFPIGRNWFFAVAVDEHDALAVASTRVDIAQGVNEQPLIDSLEASPNPVRRGQYMTMTVFGVGDTDGCVGAVEFYLDANENGQADTGESIGFGSQESQSQWSISGLDSTELTPGVYSFLARARDDDDAWGDPVQAYVEVVDTPNQPPSVAAVNSDQATIGRGDEFILTATGVSDLDGIVERVLFYWDSDDDGEFTPNDQSAKIGESHQGDNGSWSATISGDETAELPIATITLFAFAVDNVGDASTVVSTTVDVVNSAPLVGEVTVDELADGQTDSLLVGSNPTVRASGVIDIDDAVVDVVLVVDTDGDQQVDAELDWVAIPGGDGEWTWEGEVPGDWLHTSIRFGAYAVDSLGAESEIEWTGPIWINQVPTIASLEAAADVVNPDEELVLRAIGVSDEAPGVVTEVNFYRKRSDETYDWIGSGEPLGGGEWQLSRSIDSAWGTGYLTFAAQAVDDDSATSGLGDVEVTVRVNAAPVIDSLTASATYLEPGQQLVLTASSVLDLDGDGVNDVTFYLDLDADGSLMNDEMLDPDGVTSNDGTWIWTGDVPSAWSTNTYTSWAVAKDALELSGEPVSSQPIRINEPPTLGNIEASQAVYQPTDQLVLTASGVDDVPVGVVAEVNFYRKRSDETHDLIGSGEPLGGGEWQLSRSIDSAWGTGYLTFSAQAVDDDDAASALGSFEVEVLINTLPTLDSLQTLATALPPDSGLSVTLYGVADDDEAYGDYVDAVQISLGGVELPADSIEKSNTTWTWSGTIPADMPSGVHTLSAKVVDTHGGSSAYVTSELLVGFGGDATLDIQTADGDTITAKATGRGSSAVIWYTITADGVPAIYVENSDQNTRLKVRIKKSKDGDGAVSIAGLAQITNNGVAGISAKKVVLRNVDIAGGDVQIQSAMVVRLGSLSNGASILGDADVASLRLNDALGSGSIQLGSVGTLRANSLHLSGGVHVDTINKFVVDDLVDAVVVVADQSNILRRLAIKNRSRSSEGAILSFIGGAARRIRVNADLDGLLMFKYARSCIVTGDLNGSVSITGLLPTNGHDVPRSIMQLVVRGSMRTDARIAIAGSMRRLAIGSLDGGRIVLGNVDWTDNEPPGEFDPDSWLPTAKAERVRIGTSSDGTFIAPQFGDIKLGDLMVESDHVVRLYAAAVDRLRAKYLGEEQLDWRGDDAFVFDEGYEGLICDRVPYVA